MSATEYTVDLRDIQFVLFEQLRIHERLGGSEKFGEFDKDFYSSILEEITRISMEVVAPTNRTGDKEGCRLEPGGNVITPTGFKEAYRTLAEGSWLGIAADPAFGGMGLPSTMGMCATEVRTGANVALAVYAGLTEGVGNLLAIFGPDWMKETIVPRLYTGEWAGTMLLTEAGAGSAVGENRCRALPTDEPGVYRLEGEKIFISGGDQDFTENIIHMVLARTPDAPAGTRGLSIFMVPKFLVNPDGSMGARNDIFVQGIEEKMGIHGSATCSLALGATGTCLGWRVADEGEGMRVMFHLMNEARIAVGIQGLATAAAAWMNALSYAKERLQGADIERLREPDAPQVPIARHPDVRRMLMTMKVLVETMRSFLYDTALQADMAAITDDHGQKERYEGLVELFTPICKAHCSDQGFDVTRIAVQVFGGYGYISEYPVEQYLRDNKISSIYEGTNGIQAMDLVGRKMRMKNGTIFMQWLQESTRELKEARGFGFDDEVAALEKARNDVGATAMYLAQLAMSGRIPSAMVNASPFLTQFGHVLLGIQALRQALVAKKALDDGASDTAFYQGKILNLKFYVNQILPLADALSRSVRSGDDSCLDEVLFPVE